MRIARFAAGGDPQYGIVELAADGGKHPDTVSVLTGDPIAMPVQLTGERKELDGVRLLAPVIPRSKVVAVGRNYAAHAAELGNEVPDDAADLLQAEHLGDRARASRSSTPQASHEMSYEGELAVVIGRICRDVPGRPGAGGDLRLHGGQRRHRPRPAEDRRQWARAKGYDTFCPLGPVDHHPPEPGRGRRRARSAPRWTASCAGRQHQDMIFAHRRAGGLHLLLHHAAARRRDLDRHPRGRRRDAARARRSASRSRASAP